MKINKRYMNKIYPMLELKLDKIIKRFYFMRHLKEDLIQEAICEIFEKCGDIVKKFYFDINIIINILAVKAKYIMMNYCRKKYNNKIIHYNKYENNLLDYIDIIKDDRYNSELLVY